MEDLIRKQEEKHLDQVIGKIKAAKKTLEEKLEFVGKENLEKLADLRADPETGTDFEMYLEQLHEKNQSFQIKDKFQRLEEYEYLSANPYFARIDLQKDAESPTEEIYIGKFGFTDVHPVVTDWRASIASVYYRYRFPQKKVEYKTVGSTEISDLLLKRTFDIYKSQLVKYYNNDIQFDENDIIVEKIKTRTGGVLEDIVETIQQDQMDIIEADPRQICIVQGCVGSGKSTVAIHKLAHIFFHFANYIHPEKSILIVKNQILVGYLATLFPKLGIFDINFKTLRDLIINAIFREQLPIQVDLDNNTNTSSYDLQKIKDVYKQLESVHNSYNEKIASIFSTPDVESYGGYKYSKDLTPYENLDEIFEDLTEELESQKEYLKENPQSIRALIFKQNIRNIKTVLRKVNDLKYNLKREVLSEILIDLDIKINSKLNYLDTLVYLFIYGKLVGFRKVQPYEYCVIDEGQDFSLLEFAVLNNFVLRGRFGIFGDLNQGLFKDGIKNWEEIKEVIPEAKKANTFKLETNYRSTKPIIDLANKIISKYSNEFLPKSVNRMGPDPEVLIAENSEEMLQKFSLNIKGELDNLSKSIGVICYDSGIENSVEQLILKHSLPKGVYVKLDQTKRITYVPKGVYLMNINDCKGLEFSKIYILGLNTAKIYNADEARKAFVAVTRAMNELCIFGV